MNRRMRSLHRSMGVVVALFVLMLAITGVALNHTTDLKLDKQYVTWDWLLQQYGIANMWPDVVYLLDQKVISQFGNQVFVDAKPVTHSERLVLGGVILDDLIVLATDSELLLITPEGEFVERMGATENVPPMIQNIGLFHGDPVIQTRGGLWRSDFLLDQWERVSLQGVGWSLPQSMPESIEVELAEYFHGKGVTVERIILDIHNGRIFGQYGVWLMDIVGILLLVLSLTGVWIWVRRLR